MARILVTGVAGFIGSHIGERLLASGHTVIGIDSFDPFYPLSFKTFNLRALQANPQFILHRGDIRDRPFLDQIFAQEKPEYLFHAAARAGVRPSLDNPALYAEVNITGTINLLEAMAKTSLTNGVFLSSSSVYGAMETVPFRESTPLATALSPYAASKAAMETFILHYHQRLKWPLTIIRPFTVYGPRQRPEMAIHLFTRKIDLGREVEQFGEGDSERDYTFIDDFCEGAINALFKPAPGTIINLGESHTISLRDLLEKISRLLQKPVKIRRLPIQMGDMPKTYADISRARDLFNYRPTFDIDRGLQVFIEWYLSHREILYGT